LALEFAPKYNYVLCLALPGPASLLKKGAFAKARKKPYAFALLLQGRAL
jgi:hypothetical protein